MTDSHDLAALARAAIDSVGGTAAIAKQLGYTRQRVHYWRNRGVPAKEVPIVQKMVGIQPRTIRPDLFADVAPAEPDSAQ